MKITKLGHGCLLVETTDPKRVALFDPGYMSTVPIDTLPGLDDIIITHEHGDHMNVELIKQLQAAFPKARVKASTRATALLIGQGIRAEQDAVEGIEVFDAPHEPVKPLFPDADNMGVHYLDKLTNPGDCSHFTETKGVLALPVAAPWGSSVQVVQLALQLKPKHVIPVHDWHWSDEARASMYDLMEQVFQEQGITFHKVEDGKAIEIV